MTAPAGVDPRGPRFAAWVTSALLLVATFLGLIGSAAAVVIASIVAALFVWGVVSPATAPWAVLFRTVVRPRLAPPAELEDPRPPRFAQGVGLVVVALGLVLHLAGVPLALPIATAAAFIAAFLNAAFGFCLGCQLYLLLQRAGVRGRGGSAA
jgi:hypothetical protein